MASPGTPAETRAYIIERLVGDIGEPDHIIGAARSVGERALPAIVRGLADRLSAPVSVEISSVELARFADARPAQDVNHALTVAGSESSPDALILVMNPMAIAVVVSALFGADPDMPVTPIDRALSPTEVEVASMVFQEVAQAVNGSGSRAFDLALPLAPAITGAELKKHVIRDGPAVKVVFTVSTGKASGTILLMMPQRVLLKHRGGTGASAKEAAPAADWRQRFSEEVMRSTVTLEATMPLARMTLGELADLRSGQILELEEGAQARAHLSARHQTLYVCEFGKLGQNYTVRIEQPFDAGQDFIEGLMPAYGT